MSRPSAHAEGFVLAGGRSTRMGRDKALLPVGGRTLLEHALGKLATLGFAPRIAGTRPDLAAFAPVVDDLHPGCGPLGGIEAALTASAAERILVLAVDLPYLPIALLGWMLARADESGAAATVLTLEGRAQPLCAVYSRVLLPGISAAIAQGNYKVIAAVESAAEQARRPVDLFAAEDAARQLRLEPSAAMKWFRNINTPQDIER